MCEYHNMHWNHKCADCDKERIAGWRCNDCRDKQTKFQKSAAGIYRAHNKKTNGGKYVRGKCEVCGIKNAEAHHDDYAKPLEIKWLCKGHHKLHHVFDRMEKIGRPVRDQL